VLHSGARWRVASGGLNPLHSQNAAKGFYAELFGWTANDIPMGPGSVYSMMQLGGKDAAAIAPIQPEEAKQGMPPHWRLYIAVDSADAAVAKAKELGGQILAGPFDVFSSGRMAFVQDPTGAVFGLWQARDHRGVGARRQPNAFGWAELDTRDVDAAATFYTKLFGWNLKRRPEYSEWSLPGEPEQGGLMAIPPEWGPMPPAWLIYFSAASCEQSVARAQKLGARVLVPTTTIHDGGTFAVLSDPQGAVFALYQRNE
jgi:predicted enzyme related to lactoylglutathione lyase